MIPGVMQYIAAELPAGSAADPTAGDRKVWAVIAYVMTALTVLLFLFTLVMLRRIKIAVATLKVRRLRTHGCSTIRHLSKVANALAMHICLISCPLFLWLCQQQTHSHGFLSVQ
jgi:predicted cobalt transporter CbtA